MTEVSCQLSQEDLRAFRNHVQALHRAIGGRFEFLAAAGYWALAGLLVPPLRDAWPDHPATALSLGLLGLFCLSAGLVRWWSQSRWQERWTIRHGAEQRYSVSAAGLEVAEGPDSRGRHVRNWTDIVAMEETDSHLFLYRSPREAYVLPKAAFPDNLHLRQFTGLVRTGWCGAPEHSGRALPPRPPAAAEYRSQKRTETLANLLAGLRLVFFRKLDTHRFRPGVRHLLVFWLWTLVLQGAIDFCFARPDPRFDVYGASAFGCNVLLFAVGIALVAAAGGFPRSAFRLMTMLTAAQLLISVPCALLLDATDTLRADAQSWLGWMVFLAFMTWMLAVVYRSIRLLHRVSPPAALFLTSIFAAFNYALPIQLPSQSLFYPAQDDRDDAVVPDPIDVEATYYRQAALLQRQADRLLPQRPGVTDLYFLGFAGEADEKVFGNEVRYAQSLFDRQFGTAGRSLLLVNSPNTVGELPLADTHNLAAALTLIGKRMDPAEDVLFLFLTSHGSQDHRLSVRFGDLGLDDLSPGTLKTLLDRAGIRYRVIVVSACYSGGFLDVLKNADSLVMTAARRDRTSFGCGTDSDFTYFGEAYFRDALNRTPSFVDAFSIAKRLIARREASEGDEPSQPQIYVGRHIARLLQRLDTRRD